MIKQFRHLFRTTEQSPFRLAKMRTAKIIDNPSLVRDMNTQAVLNTDQLAIRRHEKRVAELQQRSARESDIDQMKTDISEIKALLRALSNSSISI